MRIKKLQDYSYIGEGIDIDKNKRTVKINLSHEDRVDTSIENNPYYYSVGDVNVISIFKRKKYIDGDGNPLLYALKGLNGWKMEQFDIELFFKQFIRISEKIKPIYDTIIKIPSQNELNNMFMDRLNKILKCEHKIDVAVQKLEKEMVFEDGVDWISMNDVETHFMEQSFLKMDTYFSFKHIPVKLRKYIKKIYDDNWINDELELGDKINDKNVLILDDTISTGSTISLFTKEFLDIYQPNEITVITLFSSI